MYYLTRLEHALKEGHLSADLGNILHAFYFSYVDAASANGYDRASVEPLLKKFLELTIEQALNPYSFEPFHERVLTPFNYYEFGIEFIRPLVVQGKSKVHYLNRVGHIVDQIAQGDNVILLANHQTELDPQAISILLEKTHPRFAEEMIIVAGHRVVSDPLAIPFSMGRNLLCIYSKKHIELDPERKEERMAHNQRTMKRMTQLLSLGGKCIYVAPSGGRDRTDRDGKIEVAHFDPQSIEMFGLMAQKAGRKTHFYPLSLATYHLLPPPNEVNKALGETRTTKATPIHMSFGAQINMDHFPGSDHADKKHKRKMRADYIWEQVRNEFHHISS